MLFPNEFTLNFEKGLMSRRKKSNIVISYSQVFVIENLCVKLDLGLGGAEICLLLKISEKRFLHTSDIRPHISPSFRC